MRIFAAFVVAICAISTASLAQGTGSPLKRDESYFCYMFNEAIDSGRSDGHFYYKHTTLNEEDPDISLKESTKFYENDASLFGSFKLVRGKQAYEGLLSYYPTLELIYFTEGSLPDEVTKDLVEISPVRKVKKEDIVSSSFDRCSPLSRTVQGYQFKDNQPRKVIAHFVYGKRIFKAGEEWLGCGEWNYNHAQLLFYVSTGGVWLEKDGKEIYVAGLGASEINYSKDNSTEIPQICEVGEYIQYKLVPAEINTEQMGVSKNIITHVGAYSKWEQQVIKNIIQGSEYFYKY